MYPDEFDLKVGDVVLFKVERDRSLGGNGSTCFRVLELNRDPGVVDLFFQKFYPCLLDKVNTLDLPLFVMGLLFLLVFLCFCLRCLFFALFRP